MAVKKNKKYTDEKIWKIYVLVFPPSKNFFINFTCQKELRTTFKDHFILRKSITKPYVEECKKNKNIPQMFFLEDFCATRNNAKSRAVAWAKLIQENGYFCINDDGFKSYIEDLLPKTIGYYEEVKEQNISHLLAENMSLFPEYKTNKQVKKNSNLIVYTLYFKPDEYTVFEKNAEELNMTKAAFGKKMILNGKIYMLDTSDFAKYIKELQEGVATMQQTVLTIHKLGQYFPSDVVKIEEFKNLVQEHYALFLKETIKLNNKISIMNKE